jgi:hypothetical protein
MLPDPTAHPPDDELLAFSLGKLDEQQSEVIARHIETCEPCSRRVISAPADSFVGLVLAAKPGAGAQRLPPKTDNSPEAAARPPEELTAAYVPPGEQVGAVIAGRYKLLEQIAEGGMGTVWIAEQTQPVRRKVALKLIKAGMDSRAVLSRFEAERQALALMEHPNIARVLDGGTTESGRPFFVMEYVKGIPFTRYCDDARLSVPQRLALLVPVCQAVQHAHQKGVIHRDLKPSNILVCLYDGKPVPKVIDFGLAKAMHQPLTEHTLHTAHGVMIGTPLYMSPEQAEFNNLDVDTRTDIYALGVILYELLTGTTPLEKQRFKDAAWQETLRLIKEEEPQRPSARLSGSRSLPSVAAQRQLEPVKLMKLVRGELDWIVMKCLEKDRSRRYDTPLNLAQAVERYLADEVVQARPPSAGYRLRKFARKNRRILTAAAGFLALLMAAVAVSSWWAVQAKRAEGDADQKRREAEQVGKQATDERNRAQIESKRAEEAAQLAKVKAADARRALDRMSVAKGIQLAEDRNLFAALPWFVRPLEHGELTKDDERVHRTRIACWLRYTPDRPTLRHMLFHDAGVTHAAFSADAKQVLTVSDKIVHVWDVRSGSAIARLEHPSAVTAAQFTPNGTRVLATVGPSVWTWDVPSGMALGTPFIDWAAFLQYLPSLPPQSPLGFLADIGARDSMHLGWHDSGGSVEISRDGRRLLVSYRQVLRLFDFETGKLIRQWPSDPTSMMDHSLSPDGKRLLLVKDGVAKVFETIPGKTEGQLIEHGNAVGSVAFSPDGTHAVTLGKDRRTARVWGFDELEDSRSGGRSRRALRLPGVQSR